MSDYHPSWYIGSVDCQIQLIITNGKALQSIGYSRFLINMEIKNFNVFASKLEPILL